MGSKMKRIVVVNYADQNFKQAQNFNTKTAKSIGKVDVVYAYGPEDIPESFKILHNDAFSHKRGAGLWLWKPYLVQKTLAAMEDGDVLFYCDAGAFFIGNIKHLIKKAGNFDILAFDIPLLEEQFTKLRVFEKLNCDTDEFRRSNQIIATYFVIKKNALTTKFVDEWLEHCSDYELLAPSTDEYERPGFISHREDQSLFSILCKKYGIQPREDVSQRRLFPKTYLYPGCEFRHIDHRGKKMPIVLFLHKNKKVSIRIVLQQIARGMKSFIK